MYEVAADRYCDFDYLVGKYSREVALPYSSLEREEEGHFELLLHTVKDLSAHVIAT